MKRLRAIVVTAVVAFGSANVVCGDVLLATFTRPGGGAGGISAFDSTTLQPVNPFLSTFLDSCWLEVVGEDIYASSAAGGLFRIDSTGKVLNSVDRPGLQLAGMAILNGELLVTHTNRDTGLTGIGRFDPLTLASRGSLIDEVATATCWLEEAGGTLYASSPTGALYRYDSNGRLIRSIQQAGMEWGGITIAGGSLLAAFTDAGPGMSGVRRIDPVTLEDQGAFVSFPTNEHSSGPFELIWSSDSLYASFLDGTLARYDATGRLLASYSQPGIEWRGLGVSAAVVPEPSCIMLVAAAAALSVYSRLRRKRSALSDGEAKIDPC